VRFQRLVAVRTDILWARNDT